MSPQQAERVRYWSCGRKKPYDDPAAAWSDIRAGTLDGTRPYRCPFTHDGHFHVGHVPTLDSLRRIARAIRVLSQGVEV